MNSVVAVVRAHVAPGGTSWLDGTPADLVHAMSLMRHHRRGESPQPMVCLTWTVRMVLLRRPRRHGRRFEPGEVPADGLAHPPGVARGQEIDHRATQHRERRGPLRHTGRV